MIRAKKSLGQNFLSDAQVARRIVESVSPHATDIILEIGPGTGALTMLLLERSGYVVAIEIDRRLIDELRHELSAKNLLIVEADALAIDWNDLIKEAINSWRELRGSQSAEPRVRIVANLPYYISTPIIERLMSLRGRLFDLTLMLQDEVVDRITSKPGTREYGYLSVLVQFHAEATKLFEVSPSAFKPAPKVQSAILHLIMRERPVVEVSDERKFFALVGAAFAQRRKTILNNLKAAAAALNFKQPIDAALRSAGIEPQRRAETLSLAEFGALHRALYES